ncbi:hypothetical protein ACFX2A_038639 [Malus domestica]
MNEVIGNLTRTVEENDLKISTLVNRLEGQHNEKADPKVDPSKEETDKKLEPLVEKAEEKLDVDRATTFMGSLSIQQLQEMYISTIKAQYEGSSHDSVLYSKPYSKKIDALRMPRGYQPPKFVQFDGKGNHKQHITHFIETCNNVGMEGDYLVKQFMHSLKGIIFYRYTDLEPNPQPLLHHPSHCNQLELISMKQWKDELVVNYINRWRSLSLDCKDRLSETSAIKMFVQGMH